MLRIVKRLMLCQLFLPAIKGSKEGLENLLRKEALIFFRCRLWSISSFDESFVSAQETVADLRDFEDLNEILTSEGDGLQGLYIQALRHLEKNSIPYRSIRYDFRELVYRTFVKSF
jgi:hypothetical protein